MKQENIAIQYWVDLEKVLIYLQEDLLRNDKKLPDFEIRPYKLMILPLIKALKPLTTSKYWLRQLEKLEKFVIELDEKNAWEVFVRAHNYGIQL